MPIIRHGKIPLEETLALVDIAEPNEVPAKLLADGMENLLGVLENVRGGLGEAKH